MGDRPGISTLDRQAIERPYLPILLVHSSGNMQLLYQYIVQTPLNLLWNRRFRHHTE